MPSKKSIVCLANSRKLNGRCVAGIELAQGRRVGWIRPVSARDHEEISENEYQYPDGCDPRPLDVIDVPLIGPKPWDYQQENWLLNPSERWQRVDRLTWGDLPPLADPIDRLWYNRYSSIHGVNDRIPQEFARRLGSSLRLIRVDYVNLSVIAPNRDFPNSKPRVMGTFSYAEDEYRFSVTDPIYEREYLRKEFGDYLIGESFVTVSLGEPYIEYCYKLIAAIMERDGGPNLSHPKIMPSSRLDTPRIR